MRWSRGFFRLWLVLSVIWAVGVFFLERPDDEYRKYKAAKIELTSADQSSLANAERIFAEKSAALEALEAAKVTLTPSELEWAKTNVTLAENGYTLTPSQQAAVEKLEMARQDSIKQARARLAVEEAQSAVEEAKNQLERSANEAKSQLRRSSNNMEFFASATLVPIALTLAIGAALAWVLRGFREVKQRDS